LLEKDVQESPKGDCKQANVDVHGAAMKNKAWEGLSFLRTQSHNTNDLSIEHKSTNAGQARRGQSHCREDDTLKARCCVKQILPGIL